MYAFRSVELYIDFRGTLFLVARCSSLGTELALAQHQNHRQGHQSLQTSPHSRAKILKLDNHPQGTYPLPLSRNLLGYCSREMVASLCLEGEVDHKHHSSTVKKKEKVCRKKN
ncbi:Contactin-associated protein-like 2 [Frankliniella fusca]|uniref:Contactin-associated protein-like 2 n=1 Tax=Frankliniella fusca TaxID=407009 RepID=A0AAE1GY81_9NEOP|nr:Contactin-associated protein-like 2 [Frankliniella fusca]